MRRVITVIAVIAILSAYQGACLRKDDVQASRVLRIAAAGNPLTLNPLFIRDSASAEAAALLHPTLLATDPETLQAEPRLFSEWQVSEDGLIYNFTLCGGAKWSDGAPVCADDIAFTLRAACHRDYTGWLFLGLRFIEGAGEYRQNHNSPFASGKISGVTVTGPHSLEIRLKEPFAPFLSYLELAPLPWHLLGGTAVANLEGHAWSRDVSAGAGPFLLKEWKTDQYLHLCANPDYFLGRPKIDEMYYTIIPNAETQVIELLAGKIDLIPTSVKVEDAAQLASDPQIMICSNSRLVYDYIGFNQRKKNSPLADKRVRLALTLVTNRKEIVENLLLGFGDEACGPLSPLHFAYLPGFTGSEYDEADARKIMEQTGRKQVKLKLIYNAGNHLRENVALLFQEKASLLGLEISIAVLEWEAFTEAFKQGDYDLVILGCGTGSDPDLTYHWHSESPGNISGYANTEVDRLLEQGVRERDKEARKELYRRAQSLIVADAPVIWLYHRHAIHAATARLNNFKPHPENVFYNVHKWTLRGRQGGV